MTSHETQELKMTRSVNRGRYARSVSKLSNGRIFFQRSSLSQRLCKMEFPLKAHFLGLLTSCRISDYNWLSKFFEATKL